MVKLYYDLPDVYVNFVDQNKIPNTYSLRAIRAFLYNIIEDQKLTIAEYLASMGNDPFFLLAATGLGKTVAAPVHVYLKNCEQVLQNLKDKKGVLLERHDVPRVWVIEPKISIAEDQERFMNSLFATFIKSRNNDKDPKKPVLFGCKTSNRDSNYFAPIKFVTTGIFAIAARLNWINPELDSVIIDEAHVTIESDEGVELGIAICRQKGIPVHYMSATVDTENLMETLEVSNVIKADKQRFPIWMHNTHTSLENCVVDLVEQTLVSPNVQSEYFPSGRDTTSQSIRNAVLEEGRAKGLLVVVNSFAGENSDAKKIADLLRKAWYGGQIEVLLLASAVIRNVAEKQKFDRLMERIEQEKLKYVIIATSVVEMGITFPTLDFIVTMDSGYENITIGDTILSEMVPLGVNSLKQRIGRVGRKRPGIGYITTEVEAYYSELEDDELNGDGLIYEPIKLPMTKGTLATLAFYSFVQQWSDIYEELCNLKLPSAIQFSQERMTRLQHERNRLIEVGIAVDNELTPEGKYCERWLGQVDMSYAIKIQQSLTSGIKRDIVFFLVVASLSEFCLSNFYEREEEPVPVRLTDGPPDDDINDNEVIDDEEVPGVCFGSFGEILRGEYDEEYDFDAAAGIEPPYIRSYNSARKSTLSDIVNQKSAVVERWGLIIGDSEIEYSPVSEILTMYNIVTYFAQKYGTVFFGESKLTSVSHAAFRKSLNNECELLGLSGEIVFGVLKGINDVYKTFVTTNQKREDFQSLFGQVKKLTFEDLLPTTLDNWDVKYQLSNLKFLPGRVILILEEVRNREYAWREEDGYREGIIRQNQTSVVLFDGLRLSAKLVPEPGNATRKAGESWKVVHAQAIEGDYT